MTQLNENVAIQFIKGLDEKDHPEIRLFRNPDRKRGQAIYKFSKPTTITLENFKSIQRMYLIDKEGQISTRKIYLSTTDSKIKEVKSTYNWDTEEEFNRFMRFAERYAKSITNS